jgi:hypothetical protein
MLNCSTAIKKTVFSLIALVIMATGAYAGNAKVTAMGLDADTYWMIQNDRSYIQFNPAQLSKNGEEFFINPVKDFGGIVISPTNPFNLLVTTGLPLDMTYMTIPGDTTGITMTREAANATGSYNLGGAAVGFSLSYTDMVKNDAAGKASKTLITSKVGFLKDLSSSMSFDTAVGANFWDLKVKPATGPTSYEASPIDFNALARFNVSVSEISKLHIFGSFSNLDRDYKTTTKIKEAWNLYTLGLSDEMTFNKSTTLYAGANLSFNSNEAGSPKVTTEYTSIKVSAGVDTAITDNLNLRFGVNRIWSYNTTVDKPKSETDTEQGGNNFTIGLGYKIGNVDLDWQLAKELFINGPYFISGGSPLTSANFEATYHFESGSSSAPATRAKK